jgi:hypothetical protein
MKVKIRMMLIKMIEMMIKAAILFCCLAFASAEVQMDTVVTVFSDSITVSCLPTFTLLSCSLDQGDTFC